MHCTKRIQIQSFFQSVFSCILTEYRDLLRESPYLVRIQENTHQKIHHIYTLFMHCIANIKDSDYHCIISLISKNKTINLMKNADLTKKNRIL